MHGVLHVLERFGQAAHHLRWLAQQMKGQPLSGLGPDARQRGERLDGAGDRLDVHEMSDVRHQMSDGFAQASTRLMSEF